MFNLLDLRDFFLPKKKFANFEHRLHLVAQTLRKVIWSQGDQIRKIFAYWSIVYFRQFFVGKLQT
jgi:hypothetical protein